MTDIVIGILVELVLSVFGWRTAIVGGCLIAIAVIVLRLVRSRMKSETGTQEH
jgi:hypothetical protein